MYSCSMWCPDDVALPRSRASHVFGSSKDAAMVRNALAVDPEVRVAHSTTNLSLSESSGSPYWHAMLLQLRPKQVTRSLTVEGSSLVM